MRSYPEFKADVLDADGNECHDELPLADVRDSYSRS